MLRGGSTSEEIERLGVSAILYKPVQKDVLLAEIGKALQC
jgi:hypothetical protein